MTTPATRYAAPVTSFRPPEAALRASAVAVEPQYSWYCIQTRDATEAVRQLHNQSFRTFWPRFWDQDRKHRPLARSLFGPYLFVAFDRCDPSWRRIPSTYGVRRLMSRDAENPIAVPQEAVQRFIDELGDSGLPDYKPHWAALPELPAGATVRVTSGALAGLTGIYQRPMHKRVAVLLRLLGGEVEASLPREAVEAVAHPA